MHLYVCSSSKWTANVHNDHFLTLYGVTNGGCSYDKNWVSLAFYDITKLDFWWGNAPLHRKWGDKCPPCPPPPPPPYSAAYAKYTVQPRLSGPRLPGTSFIRTLSCPSNVHMRMSRGAWPLIFSRRGNC